MIYILNLRGFSNFICIVDLLKSTPLHVQQYVYQCKKLRSQVQPSTNGATAPSGPWPPPLDAAILL
jgi:GrpB-like predicted nucleotidyltransferase (UPF0157 family)